MCPSLNIYSPAALADESTRKKPSGPTSRLSRRARATPEAIERGRSTRSTKPATYLISPSHLRGPIAAGEEPPRKGDVATRGEHVDACTRECDAGDSN